MAAISITGLYYAGTLAAPVLHDNLQPSGTVATEPAAGQSYQDGIYTGVGSGFRGDISVKVTVEKGLISDITVLSSNDDAQFFDRAKSDIISQIISTQSVNVDTVSGATFSSNGIIAAVADALGIEISGSDINRQPEKEESFNRENPEEADIGRFRPDSYQKAKLDLSQGTDGQYSGTGKGFRGDTNVTVTVVDHAITGITIESYRDDQRFFERAKNMVIYEILSEQSLDVDAVSGATFSSKGIMEAVADALGVSYSNPNNEGYKGEVKE